MVEKECKYDEWGLIEIPIKTIEELKKEESEYTPIKRKVSGFVVWMILFISGALTLLIIMILLLMS